MSKQDGRDRRVSAPDVDDEGAWILHADLDAFFASVELLDRPELRGRPVIVGHRAPRSVVTAATYEARAFGVNSAMPMATALRRCPQAVVVEPHFDRYRARSAEFFEACRTITPLVEEVGIDEGFLDVAGARLVAGSPKQAGELLRRRVWEATGLVCSVGAAETKFVAKLASSRAKPDGLLVVPLAETLAFLHPLPVTALPGVGGRTAELLRGRAIGTVGDLAATPIGSLERLLGAAAARRLHELANGIDPRRVTPDREEKSVGRERTFPIDLLDDTALRRELLALSDDVGSRLRRAGLRTAGVSLKVRWADLGITSRSRALERPSASGRELYEVAVELFDGLHDARGRLPQAVRLIGVRADRLEPGAAGVTLWDEPDVWAEAESAVDGARARFGRDAVRPARLLPKPDGEE